MFLHLNRSSQTTLFYVMLICCLLCGLFGRCVCVKVTWNVYAYMTIPCASATSYSLQIAAVHDIVAGVRKIQKTWWLSWRTNLSVILQTSQMASPPELNKKVEVLSCQDESASTIKDLVMLVLFCSHLLVYGLCASVVILPLTDISFNFSCEEEYIGHFAQVVACLLIAGDRPWPNWWPCKDNHIQIMDGWKNKIWKTWELLTVDWKETFYSLSLL